MPVSGATNNEPKSRLIQEGSYGCAFTPALPCKSSRASSTERQVGKIIKKKNAKIELSIATLIRAIPGHERYFIVQHEDACGPRNFEMLRSDYEEDCKTLRKAKDTQLVQLLSPHGGTSVYDLTLTNTFDYIGTFIHVLEGIVKLQTQGICHYDIHESNVLVDTRGVFRLIDFGAAFVGPEVNEKSIWRHIYSFEPSYPPQPPELSVQNGLHQGVSYGLSIQQTVLQKKVFKQMERLLGIPVSTHAREMHAFWSSLDNGWKADSWVSFFHTYWRTWDAWAVGVMFLKLLEKCFLLPAFINGPWAKHARTIRTVLKGLLEVNPTKRMSAESAVKLLSSCRVYGS
jgi:serine/threonine protein kinase